MTKQILVGIILILTAFAGWWWPVLILGAVYIFWFEAGWWPVTVGLFYDLIYGLPTAWPAVVLPTALIFVIGWFIWQVAKDHLFLISA